MDCIPLSLVLLYLRSSCSDTPLKFLDKTRTYQNSSQMTTVSPDCLPQMYPAAECALFDSCWIEACRHAPYRLQLTRLSLTLCFIFPKFFAGNEPRPSNCLHPGRPTNVVLDTVKEDKQRGPLLVFGRACGDLLAPAHRERRRALIPTPNLWL